jgi:hypothetical protein
MEEERVKEMSARMEADLQFPDGEIRQGAS